MLCKNDFYIEICREKELALGVALIYLIIQINLFYFAAKFDAFALIETNNSNEQIGQSMSILIS